MYTVPIYTVKATKLISKYKTNTKKTSKIFKKNMALSVSELVTLPVVTSL